jgi:hypothetical protein
MSRAAVHSELEQHTHMMPSLCCGWDCLFSPLAGSCSHGTLTLMPRPEGTLPCLAGLLGAVRSMRAGWLQPWPGSFVWCHCNGINVCAHGQRCILYVAGCVWTRGERSVRLRRHLTDTLPPPERGISIIWQPRPHLRHLHPSQMPAGDAQKCSWQPLHDRAGHTCLWTCSAASQLATRLRLC